MKWTEYIEIPLEAAIAQKIDISIEAEQRRAFLRRKRSMMRTKK